MPILYFRPKFSVILFLLIFQQSLGQLPYNLEDRRDHLFCKSCEQTIEEKPAEVLFGIDFRMNGDIFFSMSNKEWFDKIFKNNSYGISIDIVSKDRYDCAKPDLAAASLPKGFMTKPVYRLQLIKNQVNLTEGHFYTKVGNIPPELMGKEIEGNLVILNGNYICYYTNFVDIPRSNWELLPMGLFTDSLINQKYEKDNDKEAVFSYSRKIQLNIPFGKNSKVFSDKYIAGLSDSLHLTAYQIRKIDIRAYSSVEGPEIINTNLMHGRAQAMIQALKKYEKNLSRVSITTAENWLDFLKDIVGTEFGNLRTLSKSEIKQKLSDSSYAAKIEPLLAKERMVIATIYLDQKTPFSNFQDKSLVERFQKAVQNTDVPQARIIQKELVDRIMDNKLPIVYIDKLEVPHSKQYSNLLNDREVYKFLLKETDEYEAFDNFLSLQLLDPSNSHINYNVCALRFFMWQFGSDSISRKVLLQEINKLSNTAIPTMLIKRMLINYHILNSEEQMKVFNYSAKDSSLEIIRSLYSGMSFNDEDLLSMAKYYTYYSHSSWAQLIIDPRMDHIDVSEDLVFYYINLLFFHPEIYMSDQYRKAALNAINLNRKRFCRFFLSNAKGGASMQLLEDKTLKKLYCESCQQ